MAKYTDAGKREKVFVESYIANGFNACKAYQEAFPNASYETAHKNGYNYIKKPDVKEEIEKRITNLLGEKSDIADGILIQLKQMAFAEKKDTIYTPQIRLKALDLLQKQLNLQVTNINADINTTNTIKINISGVDTDED